MAMNLNELILQQALLHRGLIPPPLTAGTTVVPWQRAPATPKTLAQQQELLQQLAAAHRAVVMDAAGSSSPASDLNRSSSPIKRASSASFENNDQQPQKTARRTPQEQEQARLEAKRAYNRMNSARNRKRQKDLIASLKEQVEAANSRMAEMQRESDVLRVQVRLLEQENQSLVLRQHLLVAPPPTVAGGSPPQPVVASLAGGEVGSEATGASLAGTPGSPNILHAKPSTPATRLASLKRPIPSRRAGPGRLRLLDYR